MKIILSFFQNCSKEPLFVAELSEILSTNEETIPPV